MNKADLNFLKDTMIMTQVFYEPSMHKTAQDGLGSVMDTIKSKISGLVDRSLPADVNVEKILAFIGPGLLWMLGFKWISAAFAIAEALGFDWAEFFASIKEKLRPILHDLFEGKSHDPATIKQMVQESAQEATSDTIDADKLIDEVEKHGTAKDMLFIKNGLFVAAKTDSSKQTIIESLMRLPLGNKVRAGVFSFIIRIVAWILTAVLISAGVAIAGGAVSKYLGTQKNKDDEANKPSQVVQQIKHDDEAGLKLYLNPNADPSLFHSTFNDDMHVWLLHLNIDQIEDQLISWAQDLYPQLNDKSAFHSSSAFNKLVRMFKDRNKSASQLGIVAVPQPFTSIKQMIDYFAAEVAENTGK